MSTEWEEWEIWAPLELPNEDEDVVVDLSFPWPNKEQFDHELYNEPSIEKAEEEDVQNS